MTPGAGTLDQKITIERKSITRTAMGEEVATWAPLLADIWARVLPMRVQEMFAAEQIRQWYEVKFRVRYRSGITREDRVLWQGKAWEIIGDPEPFPLGNQIWLDIKAVSGVRDGR